MLWIACSMDGDSMTNIFKFFVTVASSFINFNAIWADLSICFRDKYVFHVTWVNVIYYFEKFSP